MGHSHAGQFWSTLFTTFTDFQFVLCDEADTVIAAGHTIPMVWDGTVPGLPSGYDSVLEQGVRDHEQGRVPNTLSALAAVVAPEHRGQGLSHGIVRQMGAAAAERGFPALIVPVRPTHKSRYPLTPMERYVQWTQADGWPMDPWLRVHQKLGAEFLCVAPQSLVVTGSVAEWEAWTEMRFPESGAYVVPGALVPVEIDCERDRGRYIEPNVWMLHRSPPAASDHPSSAQ
jgi:GNAT superfamily N-acetyltransferase